MMSRALTGGRPARRRALASEALEDRCLFALAITPVPAAVPAANLANAILMPNTGITITGASYVGIDNQGGTFTGFDMTTPQNQRLNIRDGVLLTSGLAGGALGPNDLPDTTNINFGAGDPDLDALVAIETFDANSLTVNFTTDIGTRSVLFDFIFGSEEFNEFLNSTFNDAFAAYLDGQQVSFDINNRPITVNNNFFRINNINGGIDIEYDGLTPRIRTTAPLNPTIPNHTLKFVIADTGDPAYDSGVFISRLQGSPTAVVAPTTDLPNPGVLTLGASNFTVDETAGIGTIVLNRVNGTSGNVTVNYAVTPGTATDGLDFTATSGVAVFTDGQTTQTITVPILDDLLPEGDETVIITLSNPDDAGLGQPSVGTLTILDNELAITFLPATITVNELVGTATLTVSRSGSIAAPASVNYQTNDGVIAGSSAVAPEDYLPRSGTVNFAPNQRTATIEVPVNQDFNDDEPTETFNVILTNPTGAELGTLFVANVLIENSDRPPSIFDITAFAPRGRVEALYVKLNDPMLPGPILDPANYSLFQHGERRFNGPPSRQRVRIREIKYDVQLRIVTLVPMRPLKNNQFYEVVARGTTESGLRGATNEALDGDLDRFGGEDFVGYFGRGTRLTYFDRNGDRVRLGAAGGAVIEVFRDISREARNVRVFGPPTGASIFGTVTPASRVADRVTGIGTLVLNGAQSFLANPPFQIGYQF
jgi:hypothetical protein